MQPENSKPMGGPEQLPMPAAANGERIPVLPTPESGIETGAERKEQTAEAQAAAADAAATDAPVAPQTQPVAVPTTDAPSTSDSPVVAADEDVIEKEWVDKAKQIIAETQDDPYSRTNRVNQLQKDYLKKRYGKELGAATER